MKSGRRKDKGKVEREKNGDLAVLVGARGEEKEERETKRVWCHISLLTMPKEEFFALWILKLAGITKQFNPRNDSKSQKENVSCGNESMTTSEQ